MKFIAILLFCSTLTSCQHEQKRIMIKDTKDYIAFQRSPEAGKIFDYNVWLVNTKTREEIQITEDLRYWEYYPVWMSDSELLYLIEPQEKTMTETDLVHANLHTGKSELLDFWTWENDPSMSKISLDSAKNIYYTGDRLDAVYMIPHNQSEPSTIEVLSSVNIEDLGLGEVLSSIATPHCTKLMLVACDTAKYRQSQEVKDYRYDIYLYDIHSKKSGRSVLQRLTDGDFDNDAPAWLDDNRIIFASNRDGNYELYLMSIKDKSLKRLTFADETEDTEPAVSPNSKYIAYSRFFTKTDRHEIWIMDLETQKTWFLTEGSAPDWNPAQ